MAAYRAAITVYMTLVVCSLRWAEAQQTDCMTALAGLTGCVSFVTNPSSTPDQKSCCVPLEAVLSSPSSFQCICAQASSSNTQASKNALLLPSACKLSINVSEANCTQSPPSSVTPSNSTPAPPGTSTTPASRSPSDGIMSASPLSLLALALLWSIVSFFT